MTLYATEADLDSKFGAREITLISDRDMDGIRDADKIEAALKTATRLINSKIGQRLPNPLADDDAEALRDYACHIARYELYDDLPPEHVVNRYKDTIAQLDQIAAGRMQFGKAEGTQPSLAPSVSSVAIVTSDTPRGWGNGAF